MTECCLATLLTHTLCNLLTWQQIEKQEALRHTHTHTHTLRYAVTPLGVATTRCSQHQLKQLWQLWRMYSAVMEYQRLSCRITGLSTVGPLLRTLPLNMGSPISPVARGIPRPMGRQNELWLLLKDWGKEVVTEQRFWWHTGPHLWKAASPLHSSSWGDRYVPLYHSFQHLYSLVGPMSEASGSVRSEERRNNNGVTTYATELVLCNHCVLGKKCGSQERRKKGLSYNTQQHPDHTSYIMMKDWSGEIAHTCAQHNILNLSRHLLIHLKHPLCQVTLIHSLLSSETQTHIHLLISLTHHMWLAKAECHTLQNAWSCKRLKSKGKRKKGVYKCSYRLCCKFETDWTHAWGKTVHKIFSHVMNQDNFAVSHCSGAYGDSGNLGTHNTRSVSHQTDVHS